MSSLLDKLFTGLFLCMLYLTCWLDLEKPRISEFLAERRYLWVNILGGCFTHRESSLDFRLLHF